MRAIAIDPGGTTGICTVRDDVPGQPRERDWHQYQIDTSDHHRQLFHMLMAYEPDLVIIEDFVFMQWKQWERNNIIYKPLEYVGVVELWCQLRKASDKPDVEFFRQQPSEAVGKSAFWSNDKLKKVGLYKAGLPHAMDATQHMLTRLMKAGQIPDLIQMLRPAEL